METVLLDQQIAPESMDAQKFPTKGQSAYAIRSQLQDSVINPSIREALPDEFTDVVIPGLDLSEPIDNSLKEYIKDKYIDKVASRESANTWWDRLNYFLKTKNLSEDEISKIKLKQQHLFELNINGKPSGKAFEVFECSGEGEPLSESELETITRTLELADQFSGGALLESLAGRRIITLAGVEAESNDWRIVGGQADIHGVIVNMDMVRNLAKRENIDPKVLLSVVLVHELLGHQVERYEKQGGIGTHFWQHFDYSKEREDGEFFNVHSAIKPKDEKAAGSKPTREYGASSPSEDLATTVEAEVSKAMGWGEEIDKLAKFKTTSDKYRRDLMLQLMDMAAKRAKEDFKHNPGAVASPIKFIRENGSFKVNKERTFLHTVHDPRQAFDKEVDRLVEAVDKRPEILIRNKHVIID